MPLLCTPRACRWVPTRPCVFLVLDAAGCLAAVDLCASTKRPVASTLLPRAPGQGAVGAATAAADGGSMRPCCMELCVSGAQTLSRLGANEGSSSSKASRGGMRRMQRAGSRAPQQASGSAGGGKEQAAVAHAVLAVVGYSSGATCCYSLAPELCAASRGPAEEVEQLAQLLLAW